jgi:hypothetical protein
VCFASSQARVAYFEVGIFLAPDFVPPAVQVVTERARPYLPEAVLFGDVFGFEDDVFQIGFGVFSYSVMLLIVYLDICFLG